MRRNDLKQQDLFKDAPIWYEGLTGRRRHFVEYYCTDKKCFLNATAAYIKAYSRDEKQLSDSSIQSNSSRMMRDPKIKDAIARLLRSHQNEEDQITEYQVLDLLKKLSFFNPKDIVDKYGNLKGNLEELGELALCVTGIKRSKNSKEIKLFDRTKSLAMLCDYLDITRPPEGNTIINPVVYLPDKDVDALREEETPEEEPMIETAEDAEYEVLENS